MYQNVLVPMALDHGVSPKTLAVAKKLVSESGTIIALHVHEALQGSVASFVDKAAVQEGFDRARAQLIAKTQGTAGVKPEIVSGHTYRTIIDFASEKDVDCIVIGSHKPGLSDYLLGSTAARVVRHAPCDVHVCRTP